PHRHAGRPRRGVPKSARAHRTEAARRAARNPDRDVRPLSPNPLGAASQPGARREGDLPRFGGEERVPVKGARATLSTAVLTLLAALAPGCRKTNSLEAPSTTVTVAVRADVTGIFPNAPIQNESFTLDV